MNKEIIVKGFQILLNTENFSSIAYEDISNFGNKA